MAHPTSSIPRLAHRTLVALALFAGTGSWAQQASAPAPATAAPNMIAEI
jgi:hypothetical protein